MNPAVTALTEVASMDPGATPRARIMAAARRLFRDEGISGATTVEAIAVAAGVSRATLYRHVSGGRDEVVVHVVTEEVADGLTSVIRRVTRTVTSFEDRIVAIFVQLERLQTASAEASAILRPSSAAAIITVDGWTDVAVEVLTRVFAPVLTDARQSGELGDEFDDSLVAEWLLRQYISLELMRSPTVDDSETFERYVRSLVVRPLRGGG